MQGITGMNFETVLLMSTIRELADMSANGYVPFSGYRNVVDTGNGESTDFYGKVIYDDTKDVYPHKEDSDAIYHAYKIVLSSAAVDEDHNIVATCDDIYEDVTMHVMIDDDGYDDDTFIEVAMGKNNSSGVIVIRNGSYYVDYYGK